MFGVNNEKKRQESFSAERSWGAVCSAAQGYFAEGYFDLYFTNKSY